MEPYFILLSVVHKDFWVPDPLLITYIKITLKHSRQKKNRAGFCCFVCLFFYGLLNETVMVLGMRECCLFFCLSGELGAGPLHFQECSSESLNFHVLYEAKPQCDHNPSCASAREKQANKQTTKQTQCKWSLTLLQVLLLLSTLPKLPEVATVPL